MEKNTLGKEVNLNGEYIYNVEKILVECEAKYNNKNSFIEYLSKLLNEKQKDLLLINQPCSQNFYTKTNEKLHAKILPDLII